MIRSSSYTWGTTGPPSAIRPVARYVRFHEGAEYGGRCMIFGGAHRLAIETTHLRSATSVMGASRRGYSILSSLLRKKARSSRSTSTPGRVSVGHQRSDIGYNTASDIFSARIGLIGLHVAVHWFPQYNRTNSRRNAVVHSYRPLTTSPHLTKATPPLPSHQ
jgi:hypothetical protein